MSTTSTQNNVTTFYYFGIMNNEPNTVWSIRVPDLLDCYGEGSSLEEVVYDTTANVKGWVLDQLTQNIALPSNSNQSEIIPAIHEQRVLITVTITPNIKLDDQYNIEVLLYIAPVFN